jgi:hypothetical protein
MATLPPLTYALDPSGISPDNLVAGEIHVMPARQKRVIAPDYGGYYTDSLVVVEQSSGDTLVRNTHYECIELFSVPTAKFGKQVCGMILLTDAAITSPVEITYQAVGGEYSKSLTALKQLIESLELDTRPATWPEIIGRPEEFPPTHHLHDSGDIYGFEYMVHALERIRRAIELGDTITHDAVFRYIDQVMADHPTLTTVATLIATAISNHTSADNPHPQYQTTTPEVKAPVIITPNVDESVAGLTPRIQASDYRSLYAVEHGGTQFQIATNIGFTAGLYSTPTLGPVTYFDVPAGVLAASSSYFTRARYMSVEGVFSPWSTPMAFATGSAVIAQPIMSTPLNGATNVSLTPTLTSSAFAMSQGTDTHYATEWEIATGSNGGGTVLWNSGQDTVNRTSILVPDGILIPSTPYHYRARYRGASTGVSAFALSKMFTTAAAAPSIPPIGSVYGGGFVAGYFRIGVQKYVLIVAPRSVGEHSAIRFSEHYHNMAVSSQSTFDGLANTNAMAVANQSFLGRFQAAAWVRSLVIAGFADWYMPARDELEIIYRYLKSDPNGNNTSQRQDGQQMGVNAYSDPIGAAYTTLNPAQTAVTPFIQYGEEAFLSNSPYWSSTRLSNQDTSHEKIWVQRMAGSNNGTQATGDSGSNYPVRAVRRVAVPG